MIIDTKYSTGDRVFFIYGTQGSSWYTNTNSVSILELGIRVSEGVCDVVYFVSTSIDKPRLGSWVAERDLFASIEEADAECKRRNGGSR